MHSSPMARAYTHGQRLHFDRARSTIPTPGHEKWVVLHVVCYLAHY